MWQHSGSKALESVEFTQGVIQKLRGQEFDYFWKPTYLDVDIFYPKRGQKKSIFWPPTHLILST